MLLVVPFSLLVFIVFIHMQSGYSEVRAMNRFLSPRLLQQSPCIYIRHNTIKHDQFASNAGEVNYIHVKYNTSECRSLYTCQMEQDKQEQNVK